MHPAIIATLGVVLFWIVANGINVLLRDSGLDPVTGIIASVCVGAIVYRIASRAERNE